MDKQNVVNSYKETLIHNKKQHKNDVLNNMDKLQKHYAKLKKPDISSTIDKTNLDDRNHITACLQGGEIVKRQKGTFRNDGNVLYFISGVLYMDVYICKNGWKFTH